MIGLTAGDRRTLLLGIGVISVLLLGARGIPAWRRWDADARESGAELAAAAAVAQADVRNVAALSDSVAAREARLVAMAPRILDGSTPAAAGASLASLVSGAAARARVALGSVQVQQDTAGNGTFVRVSVRGDATGDLPGITRMLALLEGGPELLAVRELSIVQPDAGGPADRVETLRLEFTVQGLALRVPVERGP